VAEHGLKDPVLALAWDGTGHGLDGTIWGGEALLMEGTTFRRVGHLKPFPLLGGDAAARDPRRSAFGLLWATRGLDLRAHACSWFGQGELAAFQTMLERGVQTPKTSSMGRLFDAVAALTGIHTRKGFEGQAAMALEAAAQEGWMGGSYPWTFAGGTVCVADPATVLEELLRDEARGVDANDLAYRFHASLADLALVWANHGGVADVVLSGGCFQNALLTALVTKRLASSGFRVHRHRTFPPNDGCISLGQASVAGACLIA
jgi:hydrogenase maturation protein HypF